MTQPPIIGITTNDRFELYYKLREEYVAAVRRAGGVPVMLPPGETQLDALLTGLDGIIFSGGVDVDPTHYQGNIEHPTLSRLEPVRDSFEIGLAHKTMSLQLPALYICRGAQILNVALGGSLIEHLPDEVGESVKHNRPPRDSIPHQIRVEPASRLAEILGGSEMTTASWHHQAARRVAANLQAVAFAPDGTIEALEMPDYACLVAVQWHPELTAATDPGQQRLFDWLVGAARQFRQGRF